MPDKNTTVFHWSSGKDSALAFHYLQKNDSYQVNQLITTINEQYNRVTMHGTPLKLLERQVESIGIDHRLIELPQSPSMDEYEQQMKTAMLRLRQEGYTHAAFGDIFLEDLKSYREKEMESLGFQSVFPLWKKDTRALIKQFIDLGFKAVIVCANDQLGEKFLGRTIDQSFLDDLPSGIDPCGENGEFHTFCYDGPIFKTPIQFHLGEKIKRTYPNPSGEDSVDFWFIDLVE